MPFVGDVRLSAISSDDTNAKFDAIVRQVNEWGRTISNEKVANVNTDAAGTPRIVTGVQTVSDIDIVGTVYYDANGVHRIMQGVVTISSTSNVVGTVTFDSSGNYRLLQGVVTISPTLNVLGTATFDSSGNYRLLQGVIETGSDTIVGTIHYNTSGTAVMLQGTAPNDDRTGSWIAQSGIDVIDELNA